MQFTYIFICANLIAYCSSCTTCYICGGFIKNQANLYTLLKNPSTGFCIYKAFKINSKNCQTNYCTVDLLIEIAYSDIQKAKSIQDASIKHIRLRRRCEHRTTELSEYANDVCHIHNDEGRKQYITRCIYICNSDFCNGDNTYNVFFKNKLFKHFPECRLCEDQINIEGIIDASILSSIQCNKPVNPENKYSYKPCAGHCFTSIVYFYNKLDIAKGCKVSNPKKNRYKIRGYKYCKTTMNPCNNQIIYTMNDITDSDVLKNMIAKSSSDYNKKIYIKTTRCRVCSADTANNTKTSLNCFLSDENQQHPYSWITCTTSCFVSYHESHESSPKRKIIIRGCRDKDDIKNKVPTCIGKLSDNIEKENEKAKITEELSIDTKVECVKVCALKKCDGYIYNINNKKCEIYNKYGKGVQRQYSTLSKFSMKCYKSCKPSLTNTCIKQNLDQLFEIWIKYILKINSTKEVFHDEIGTMPDTNSTAEYVSNKETTSNMYKDNIEYVTNHQDTDINSMNGKYSNDESRDHNDEDEDEEISDKMIFLIISLCITMLLCIVYFLIKKDVLGKPKEINYSHFHSSSTQGDTLIK